MILRMLGIILIIHERTMNFHPLNTFRNLLESFSIFPYSSKFVDFCIYHLLFNNKKKKKS